SKPPPGLRIQPDRPWWSLWWGQPRGSCAFTRAPQCCPARDPALAARPAADPGAFGASVLEEKFAMIHFKCPDCSTPLKRDDHEAGTKIPCPGCGQRLKIPQPPVPSPVPKTVLGILQPATQNKTVLGVLRPATRLVAPTQAAGSSLTN